MSVLRPITERRCPLGCVIRSTKYLFRDETLMSFSSEAYLNTGRHACCTFMIATQLLRGAGMGGGEGSFSARRTHAPEKTREVRAARAKAGCCPYGFERSEAVSDTGKPRRSLAGKRDTATHPPTLLRDSVTRTCECSYSVPRPRPATLVQLVRREHNRRRRIHDGESLRQSLSSADAMQAYGQQDAQLGQGSDPIMSSF